jgi:hypothetical protein
MRYSFCLTLIVFFGLTCANNCLAQSSGSNSEFVARSFESAVGDLLKDYELPESLYLEFECSNCPQDFFRNKLIRILNERASDVYIDKDRDVLDKCRFHLYRSEFSYAKSGGSLFRKGNLERVFDVSLTAICVDSSGRVIWQNEKEGLFTEEINWNEAELAEQRSEALFSSELPATSRSRLWEPVVISGILGGLVYLFFASR